MSRTRHLSTQSAHWQRRKRALRTLERRAQRHQTRALLADEARVGALADVSLEILADAEEEAGRFARAELLRRGRDTPPLP